MSDPHDPHPTDEAPARPRRTPRRWLWRGLLIVALIILLPVAGLLLRLAQGPLDLPETIVARVEQRIDSAMPNSRASLGAISVALSPARQVVIVMNDVTIDDAGGGERARFPSLQVTLAPGALITGQARARQVSLEGAQMRLLRDQDGQFDIDFGGGDEAAERTVTESLARLDAMVSSPAFAHLDDILVSGLDLALEDEITGRTLTLRDARAELTRQDGTLSIGIIGALDGSRDAQLEIAMSRRAAAGITEIGAGFSGLAARDLASFAPALGWLDLLRAPLAGDVVAQLDDDGTVSGFAATIAAGQGTIAVAEGADPLTLDGFSAAMRYDPETRRLAFAELRLAAPALSFAAEGFADMAPDGQSFVSQLTLDDIVIDPAGMFDAPRSFDGAAVDLRLALTPEVQLDLGQVVLFDEDLRLRADGTIRATPDGLDITVNGAIPEAEMRTIIDYWPPLAAPGSREWADRSLHAGRVIGADIALRVRPGAAPMRAIQFDFDGVEMTPIRGDLRITDAAGYFSMVDRRLVTRIDSGRIPTPAGDTLDFIDSTMTIETLGVPGPEARFDMNIAGGLVPLLSALDEPPFNLFARGEMTPERFGQGRAEVSATLIARLRTRGEDPPPRTGLDGINLTGTGTITGFASSRLIPDRALAADRLDVVFAPDGITVDGQARFDGVPLTGSWRRDFGADVTGSRVEARAQIDAAALDQLGVGLPDGLLSGRGPVEVGVDIRDDGPALLRLDSTLSGLALAIPELGWRLAPEASGRLQLEARLGPTPEITLLNLDAAGLTLNGAMQLRPGGGMERLTASRFRIGDWLDVVGALVGREPGRAPEIEVSGGVLDLRRAPVMGGDGDGGGPLRVALDRLQISDSIAVTALDADLSTAGGLQGNFVGRINGDTPVQGDITPGEDGAVIRLRAQDGGAALRAAGVYRNLYGGALDLTLRAQGPRGVYRGRLEIDSPRLRNAPAMAELLNAVSVVGLIEQLGGTGINLGPVDARFTLTPDTITLREGTALGPSIGLSMDGTFDTATRQIDLQGVVSPLYLVNGIVGALFAPRREGLFGFTYRVTGNADAPDVNVNPLSILTPGIFREIFRRPPPDPAQAP